MNAGELIATYTYDEEADGKLLINFNDVWAWAMAYGEEVAEDQVEEVARLIRAWGWAGLLYWCSEKNSTDGVGMRSEFLDINRFVEFVRQEEALMKREPKSSKRAYLKHTYTLGEELP